MIHGDGTGVTFDPLHCALHESAEEAPASFTLIFQLAPNGDSKLAE